MEAPFAPGFEFPFFVPPVSRVLVDKIGRLTGFKFSSMVPTPPGRAFVGEMGLLMGSGFPSFVSISSGMVLVGEMGPLAVSIGGAVRLFLLNGLSIADCDFRIVGCSPGIWSLTMVRYMISDLPVDIFLIHDEDFV